MKKKQCHDTAQGRYSAFQRNQIFIVYTSNEHASYIKPVPCASVGGVEICVYVNSGSESGSEGMGEAKAEAGALVRPNRARTVSGPRCWAARLEPDGGRWRGCFRGGPSRPAPRAHRLARSRIFPRASHECLDPRDGAVSSIGTLGCFSNRLARLLFPLNAAVSRVASPARRCDGQLLIPASVSVNT